MKKFFSLVVLMGVLILGGTQKAEAVLINYDGTGNDWPTEIGSYYSGLPGGPVHSSGFMWLDYSGYVDSTYGPHSTTAMAFSYYDNPVWIDWSTPVNDVSFWYGYHYPLSVKGFSGGTEVFNSGTLPANSSGMFQYVAPDVSIDRLTFYGTPNYWTMDDLSYGGGGNGGDPAIPEPASMMLLGSGLLGMVGFRRKK